MVKNLLTVPKPWLPNDAKYSPLPFSELCSFTEGVDTTFLDFLDFLGSCFNTTIACFLNFDVGLVMVSERTLKMVSQFKISESW